MQIGSQTTPLPSYEEALADPVKARVLFDASKGGNVLGITEDHRFALADVFSRKGSPRTTATAISFTPGIDTSGMHILLVDGEAVVITPSFFDAHRTFKALGREHFASHVCWMKDDAASGLIEQASRPAYDNACCGSDF